jgi:ERF superfamily
VTDEETTKPPSLAAKIAMVQKQAEVDHLAKRTVTVNIAAKGDRAAGSYSYGYIEESTLMEKIRPLLAEHGVAVYYSDEIISITGNLAQVRVFLTLVDGDTGEEFQMHADGVGTDSGDKHVSKAKTTAMRYLLWKWFLVPSGDVDPESENVQRERRPPREQIQWATQEDVQAFLKEVEEAGFKIEPSKAAADQEHLEWDGWRADWLAGQRRSFEQAKAAKGSPA